MCLLSNREQTKTRCHLMERSNFSVRYLKECREKSDTKGILTSLTCLKKHLRGAKNAGDVDRDTFGLLVDLIKYPNWKIMDTSMSILADCCLSTSHREIFKEMSCVPHLILIIKTVDNESILCRAYRLLGNLAASRSLALILIEYNAGTILIDSLLTNNDRSPTTLKMIYRAVKKLWIVKDFRWKMLPEDLPTKLNNCLDSRNDQMTTVIIELLTLFSSVKKSQNKNAFKVSKEILTKLIDLAEQEEMTEVTMNCLSNLICYQTNEVWQHLEGSKLPEIFINYVQKMDTINKGVLEAFYKLCTEGGVRSKVKASGLLPKLMKFCSGTNVDRILPIFYLFQFDVSSIAMLATEKDFVSLLTRNITKDGVVRLLSVVSRLDPPVKELVQEENLTVIIRHKECHGILRKISQTKKFLRELIVSGKIWEISKVNCLSEEQDPYMESLLVHLLRTGEKDEVENAALAVPFLVKPSHFTLYNMLVRNDAIKIILRLLHDKMLEERILASIVKLINIFQGSFYKNYTRELGIFEFEKSQGPSPVMNENPTEVVKSTSQMVDTIDTNGQIEHKERISADPTTVTFELDSGALVTVNRGLFCKNSPVLDAMLNGYFIESNQRKVKLSCCTEEALLHLERLLKDNTTPPEMTIETHLELISLTDRFLMSDLNDVLTASLPIDEGSCVAVLQWCRNSGYTENNRLIRTRVYEFVFSSSSYLLLAMQNDSLRSPLIEEITNYIWNAFVDLL